MNSFLNNVAWAIPQAQRTGNYFVCLPKGVAQIPKIKFGSNIPSNSTGLRGSGLPADRPVMPKTAEKGDFNGIHERVFIAADDVLQRLKDAFAAEDDTGPRRSGNISFWSRVDHADCGRQFTAAIGDEDNPDADIKSEVYQIFNCADDDDGPEAGGGGLQVEALASRNRASAGPLDDPAQNEALDAKATALLKRHAPAKVKPAREPRPEPYRIAHRNAMLCCQEALEWVLVTEDDPNLEAARTKIVIPWLQSRMSLRAFATLKGIDRDKLRRTIDRYAEAVAVRVNSTGGALKADLRDVSGYAAPKCPKTKHASRKYPLSFWLNAPDGSKCPGRVWSGPPLIYAPQASWPAAEAFFTSIAQSGPCAMRAAHALPE